jgi:methionyl-tRNA synthetase
MKNKFYITTAIPYVNAPAHIGFAMELVQADVLARYHRLSGDDTFFLNGTDENALKNVQAAEKAGIPVKEFIDDHAERFKNLSKVLNISNDDFVRTTQERHVKSSQKLWRLCEETSDIYKKKYKGLYCVECEEFKTKKELIDGKCPEHGTIPEEVEEENYFFRLSKYQKDLERLIDSGELKIIPETRKNEVREFIRQGLEDFSVSRSRERAKNWGIAVPNDDTQIMYVWFDALVNYLTGLNFADEGELYKKYWLENDQRNHLVGKGITRFHAIYWPAMLLSARIKPPSTIFVHGYINLGGEKMSKSVGNVVDPFTLVEKYGTDIVRYYLLREFSSIGDGDFSEQNLVGRYNGDLANGLGNLVARVSTLIENNLTEGLAFDSARIDSATLQAIEDAKKPFTAGLENFRLHESLGAIWQLIAHADRYVNDTKPWVLAKEDAKKFESVMINLVKIILHITFALAPFMPETADKIMDVFDFKKNNLEGQKLVIKKGAVLFPRLP